MDEPESGTREFDMSEGLALAVAYLDDPSDVPCPTCGPGQMEVVCYLDAHAIESGDVTPASPDGDYTVVLYCHKCGRAAALDLSRGGGQDRAENREAA